MRHFMVATMLLLAACGDPQSTLEPGRWTGAVEFDTGAAQQGLAMLVPKSASIDRCLTHEQAKQPADFMVGGHESCDKSGVTVANGRIEGSVRCSPEFGGTSEVRGQYTPTSYELTMTTGNIKGRARVERVGDCPAG